MVVHAEAKVSRGAECLPYPEELYWCWLEIMMRIRAFELAANSAYMEGHIRGFLHLYLGEEAVAAAAVTARRPSDPIIHAYRCHGMALACGMSARAGMAELFGKITGCCKGKGGSMHFFDREHNFWGGFAIVGGQIPVGVGIAFAEKYRRTGNVCLTFFGDGAANQGVLLESLNLAKLLELPVVFVCENNVYGMGTAVWRACALHTQGGIYRIAEPYGIPARWIYGQDVEEVYEAFREAIEYARHNSEPYFLEIRTYRYRGHSMSDPGKYRVREELDDYRLRDPIERLKRRMLEAGIATEEQISELEEKIDREIEDAVEFALQSPYPPEEELYRDVYLDPDYPFIKD